MPRPDELNDADRSHVRLLVDIAHVVLTSAVGVLLDDDLFRALRLVDDVVARLKAENPFHQENKS
jgi:hypothetical protein